MEAAAQAIYEAYGAPSCARGPPGERRQRLPLGRHRRPVVPGSASTTPTPTAPVAPSPAPWPPTWPRGFPWRTVSAGQRPTLRCPGGHAGPGAGSGAHGPRVCPARPPGGRGGAPVTGGPLGAGGPGGYPSGGWGSYGASGRKRPLPRLPGRGPHFSREMGRKRAGGKPLDPPVFMARFLPLARFGVCATLSRSWGYFAAHLRTLIWGLSFIKCFFSIFFTRKCVPNRS